MSKPQNSFSVVTRGPRATAVPRLRTGSACRDKYDIAMTGNAYPTAAHIDVPEGVKLVSYDHGILTAQNIDTGMRYVIVPGGKGGSAMMRRVCVGGSRLETPHDYGSCHAIEHADFRSLDWNDFAGMMKNASTSKLAIIHECHLLLDVDAGHLQKELGFQRDTMLGTNMRRLEPTAILREIDNVLDERDFNAQAGAAFRNMIMESDRLMLERVWEAGANVTPTVGTDSALSNIRTSDDLMRLHHTYRDSSRTHMVLAGPIDLNRTLALLHETFHDVKSQTPELLRPIPQSTQPSQFGAVSSAISLDSGNRGICVSGIKSAYNSDSDVCEVMRHIVGVLGSQPPVKMSGLTDVTMYFNPEEQAGTFSILGNVASEGDEEVALSRAQEAIHDHIITPLCAFDDPQTLAALLKQYRSKMHLASDSNPQQLSAMAVQGILACNKASLAWHIDDRFADRCITCERVRGVARRLFDPDQLAVVRCTGTTGSACSAVVSHFKTAPQLRAFTNHTMAPFNTVMSHSHLAADNGGRTTRTAEFMRSIEPAAIHPIRVTDQRCNDIALCAYNANKVLPVRQKTLDCSFGKLEHYGGWAQAMLAVEAMNAISKVVAGGACRFKLEQGHVMATLESDSAVPTQYLWTQPLVSCVAMAAAASGAVGQINGISQLTAQLPEAAYQEAVLTATKDFHSPSKLALCQARSQLCNSLDPGYAPANLAIAKQMLSVEKNRVNSSLRVLNDVVPRLYGTNVSATELTGTVQKLGTIAAEARQISRSLNLTQERVQTRLRSSHAPDMKLIQTMPGLRTYPYVASVQAMRPLARADRAAFIVSNQVMVGGMGSVYTHDIRSRGISYRPAGLTALGWQANPVLLLHATFDQNQAQEGAARTTTSMRRWASGDKQVFTADAVSTAKRAILEQMQLMRMEYEAQKYNMWADLDPDKFSSAEVREAIAGVTAQQITATMPRYFSAAPQIQESWVKAVQTLPAS